MKAKKAGLSFLGGLLMTLFLVIAVPIIVDSYVQRYITDVVGDTTFLTLSSDVIVNLLVWTIVIGFVVLLGAGGILKDSASSGSWDSWSHTGFSETSRTPSYRWRPSP